MQNISLEIEYVGTNYFGFQIQEKKNTKEITIQGVLEEALTKFFGQKIRIVYASRTDRGVHARGQIINFKIDTTAPLKNIKTAINSLLPPDIRIKKIKAVGLDFHARFWAKSKIYRYIILNKKEPSVFWEGFAWQVTDELDLAAMEKVANKLLGKKDFSLFAKKPEKYKDAIRTIKSIAVKKKGNFAYIEIEADGFLRYMARNIVSFLIKVASGKISTKVVDPILQKKAKYINKPAPAAGLYLCSVKY